VRIAFMTIREKFTRKVRRSYCKVRRIPISYWDLTYEEQYELIRGALRGLGPQEEDARSHS
jgi:hypothetical protein